MKTRHVVHDIFILECTSVSAASGRCKSLQARAARQSSRLSLNIYQRRTGLPPPFQAFARSILLLLQMHRLSLQRRKINIFKLDIMQILVVGLAFPTVRIPVVEVACRQDSQPEDIVGSQLGNHNVQVVADSSADNLAVVAGRQMHLHL